MCTKSKYKLLYRKKVHKKALICKENMLNLNYFLDLLKTVKNRDVNIELFSTYSQLQLVLFLRDYWYTLNGWEVPQNNTVWEEIKNAEKKKSNISISA